MDAANILKPYLTDGSVRIIGSTTTNEYRKFIEKDKALARGDLCLWIFPSLQ